MGRLVEEARQRWPAGTVRWTPPENLHLTLRFLGDTPAARVTPVRQGLQEALAGQAACHLRLVRMGAFPRMQRPQVLWAGVGGDIGALEGLQRRIEKTVRRLGFAAETRPYRPHLTLGRVKRGMHPPVDWVCEPPPFEFAVVKVQLVRSQLGTGGAQYSVLGTHSLT